ncbi:MAG TPA: YoaK family protein, partial [Acidothermaceae bacterium]|nr:YoaK family protein [Acidothermaceae bacterium]
MSSRNVGARARYDLDFVVRHGVVSTHAIWQYTGLLALLVLAMGLQTATLRRIGRRTVRTTYVTGMFTHLAEETVGYFADRHDARHDPSRPESMQARAGRVRVLLGVWSTYAAGGVCGGFCEISWAAYALAVP